MFRADSLYRDSFRTRPGVSMVSICFFSCRGGGPLLGKLPPVVQITQNITGAGKSLPAEFHLHRTTLLPYGIVSPLWYCAIPGKSVLLWNSAVGLLLEANHDINMLQTGAYPYPLKRRIMGDSGHLSNERSGQLLCELLHDKFGSVILGHLS